MKTSWVPTSMFTYLPLPLPPRGSGFNSVWIPVCGLGTSPSYQLRFPDGCANSRPLKSVSEAWSGVEDIPPSSLPSLTALKMLELIVPVLYWHDINIGQIFKGKKQLIHPHICLRQGRQPGHSQIIVSHYGNLYLKSIPGSGSAALCIYILCDCPSYKILCSRGWWYTFVVFFLYMGCPQIHLENLP